MSERAKGWYWVRISEDWEAAKWTGDSWRAAGVDDCVFDGEVYEYGPRIPTPDESWQCVPKDPTDVMLDSTAWAWAASPMRIKDVWTDMLSAAPKPEDV